MKIETEIPLADEILSGYSDAIQGDGLGYRNHVFRLLNFCFALNEPNSSDREKLVIAAAFHDIGIWTGATFDYLPPSIVESKKYLEKVRRDEWSDEIEEIIEMHHRLRKYPSGRLVETFRKADLIDLSLGIFKCGLSKSYISEVKAALPNAGFHKCLIKVAGQWISRHPLDPVPVLKF